MSTKKKSAEQHPADTAAAGRLTPWKMGGDIKGAEMQVLTAPPIVKLKEMPIGAVLDGTLIDVIPSRNPSIKNPLFILSIDGQDYSIPGQAVIVKALLPEYEDKKDRDNPAAKCPYLKRRVLLKKTGIKQSRTYKTDEGEPRDFAVYDIAVGEAE